jgi:hypothetical protein
VAATYRAPTVGRRERERSLSHRCPKVRYDFFSAGDVSPCAYLQRIATTKMSGPRARVMRNPRGRPLDRNAKCPLLGLKRTWVDALRMSAFDPKRRLGGTGFIDESIRGEAGGSGPSRVGVKRSYPRFSPVELRGWGCLRFWLRRTAPKYLSDLCRCPAANVITTALKFGNRLPFELFQGFLPPSHDAENRETLLAALCRQSQKSNF